MCTVTLCVFSQFALATGGGATSGGAFLKGGTDDPVGRERVPLVGTDGLFTGRPKHSSIRLITVYAPGAEGDHLILREIVFPDGTTSLLLSAPPALTDRARRVAVFLRRDASKVGLLEYEDGHWTRRTPHLLQVTGTPGAVEDDQLAAFVMTRLGSSWLLDNPALTRSSLSAVPRDPSSSSLVGGGIGRGILPWVCALLLLLVGSAVSRVAHRAERRTGQ